MKTYSCISRTGEPNSYPMVEDPDGQWVMCHEVEPLISRLRQALRRIATEGERVGGRASAISARAALNECREVRR